MSENQKSDPLHDRVWIQNNSNNIFDVLLWEPEREEPTPPKAVRKPVQKTKSGKKRFKGLPVPPEWYTTSVKTGK